MAMIAQALNPKPPNSLSLVSSITSLLQILNPQIYYNPNPLTQFSQHLNPNLVLEIIKNQTSPDHALFFFKWATNPYPNPNNYTHSQKCYLAITDLLISHNLFSSAQDLLESSNKFDDFFVSKLIKAHADKGQINLALSLFDSVKKRENGKCLFSCTAILGVLVRVKRVDLAKNIFDEIVKDGVVKADVSMYTTMIKGFCKMGLVDDALKMFHEMPCGRNLITYNTMVDGLCKKGLMEKALEVVDRMMGSKECLPDRVTYTSLIDGYCRNGEYDRAKKCFDEMVSMDRNCKPNVVTYNALIYGLCMRGNVFETKELMECMRLDGIRDNISAHTSLLKGYCIAGRSEDAIKHLKEMISLGMGPEMKAYVVIANEYCKLRRPNEAIALLNEMRTRSLHPSVSSYNAVLKALVDMGEHDRAMVVILSHMRQLGCNPNFFSYYVLILGLLRAKRTMLEVEGLVSDMLRNGHQLDAELWSSLVEGYCEEGNGKKAMQVCQESMETGYLINIGSFSTLATKLRANGHVFEIQNLLSQMSTKFYATNLDKYREVSEKGSVG